MINSVNYDIQFYIVDTTHINAIADLRTKEVLINKLSSVKQKLEESSNADYQNSRYYHYLDNHFKALLDEGEPLLFNCREVADEQRGNRIKTVDSYLLKLNNGETLSQAELDFVRSILFGLHNQKILKDYWYNENEIYFRKSVIQKLFKVIPNMKKQYEEQDDRDYFSIFEHEKTFNFLLNGSYQHLYVLQKEDISKISDLINTDKKFIKNNELEVEILKEMVDYNTKNGDYIILYFSGE